ncbi:hypothetical protein ACLBXM_17825 [Xanthobacteraceae bacterium A53D]
MAKQVFYVVQPYDPAKRGGGLKAGQPMEASSEADARRKAERMARVRAGAIAFSKQVDPDSDDADPAVFIASFGRVPDEALELA